MWFFNRVPREMYEREKERADLMFQALNTERNRYTDLVKLMARLKAKGLELAPEPRKARVVDESDEAIAKARIAELADPFVQNYVKDLVAQGASEADALKEARSVREEVGRVTQQPASER